MFTRVFLRVFFLVLVFCSAAIAQNQCPDGTKSDKLACLIPQVYGINGLQVQNPQQGVFSADFLTDRLRPVEASIARQSALLPLASPSSGITFSFDPVTKTFKSSTDSLGPIFGERGETIGRHHVFLGFSYQYFNFDSLDGISLKKLPVLLTQPDDDTTINGGQKGIPICTINIPSPNPSVNGSNNPKFSNTGQCGYIRDVIESVNSIDLKIHQFTTFVTFGITDRIDVSVAIPIENVRMNVTSDATIIHNDRPSQYSHVFPNSSDCVDSLQPTNPDACLHHTFSNGSTASGIGDIVLRVKGTAWKGERAALALGVDVRVPTGDQLNFLGAGAAGVKPFVVWSYRSRIAPHLLFGYETNGSSRIAGNLTTGAKEKLPNQVTYSAGADVWFTKWLTGAFDIVGQQVFQAPRSAPTTTFDLGQCADTTDNLGNVTQCDPNGALLRAPQQHADILQSTGSFNVTNASVGVKIRPFSNLLITGNVQIKLNEGGLRANVVPLVGVSYTF